MWTGGLQLLVFWTLILHGHTRHFHTNIRKLDKSLEGASETEKTRRLVECVYRCIQHTDCRSFGYNKTSTICHLYTSQTGSTQSSNGILLFGNMRENKTGREKEILYQTTPTIILQQQERIVLSRQRLAWKKALAACRKNGRHLLRIDNETDQATAVKIVNDSGLECVANGVFKKIFTWFNMDHKHLGYKNWVEGEPGFMDYFACLSKRNKYKWEGVGLVSCAGRNSSNTVSNCRTMTPLYKC